MASETLYESMCAREQVRVKGFVASLWSLLVVLQLVLEVYERVYFCNSKVIIARRMTHLSRAHTECQ